MKQIFLLIIILSLNCKETRYESSEILYEDATIMNTLYTPSTHRTELGFGPTINMDGDIEFRPKITSVTTPENFAVIFECQHGGFISQGSDNRHKLLFERFKRRAGAKVEVSYKELYRCVYEDTTGDGQKELIE